MPAANHQILRAQFHQLYEPVGAIGDPCIYCGVLSSGFDHVPPLHFVGRIPAEELAQHRLRLLPSCKQCNSWLTGLLLSTIEARRQRVRKRLATKYAHLLRIPQWDEADLNTMSIKLADDIRRSMNFAAHVRARLNFHSGASS